MGAERALCASARPVSVATRSAGAAVPSLIQRAACGIYLCFMKKVNSPPSSACDSSWCPVCLQKVWKSFTEPGSVATIFSTSPALSPVSAFLVRRIGSGQFNPRVSSSFAASMGKNLSRHRLVIEVLRVPRLGEKVPALGEQARKLQNECQDVNRERAAAPAEQKAGQREDEDQESPARRHKDRLGFAMKELAGVERAGGETLRFLLHLRVRDADGALRGRFRPQAGVADQR